MEIENPETANPFYEYRRISAFNRQQQNYRGASSDLVSNICIPLQRVFKTFCLPQNERRGKERPIFELRIYRILHRVDS